MTDRSSRFPAAPLFVVGAISQYAGASIAVRLFDDLAPAGIAWLRLLGAGVILALWRRPDPRRWSTPDRWTVVRFGLALAGMNLSIYYAIERLPLGNAVAIEFLGPITVAALGVRNGRNLLALLLALGGLALLVDVELDGEPLGIVFALGAAACWALYIWFGAQIAERGLGVDGLAVAGLVGAVAIAPLGAPAAASATDDPVVLALSLGVAILSSVVPYVIDQAVLRLVDAARFALLNALLPVTASVIGAIALAQIPSPAAALAIALVIAALAIRDPGGETATRRWRPRSGPDPTREQL